MSVETKSLSLDQQQIYDLLVKGLAVPVIAKKLDKPEGIVAAQITRMHNKGISLPSDAGFTPQPKKKGYDPAVELAAPTKKPATTGGSSNEQVIQEAQKAGPALDHEALKKLAEQVGDSITKDVHPMVLLGVTIQFVRMCGGRYTAHQLIEDVYGALKSFVGYTGKDAEVEMGPMNLSSSEEATKLREQNLELRKRLEKLENPDR